MLMENLKTHLALARLLIWSWGQWAMGIDNFRQSSGCWWYVSYEFQHIFYHQLHYIPNFSMI